MGSVFSADLRGQLDHIALQILPLYPNSFLELSSLLRALSKIYPFPFPSLGKVPVGTRPPRPPLRTAGLLLEVYRYLAGCFHDPSLLLTSKLSPAQPLSYAAPFK